MGLLHPRLKRVDGLLQIGRWKVYPDGSDGGAINRRTVRVNRRWGNQRQGAQHGIEADGDPRIVGHRFGMPEDVVRNEQIGKGKKPTKIGNFPHEVCGERKELIGDPQTDDGGRHGDRSLNKRRQINGDRDIVEDDTRRVMQKIHQIARPFQTARSGKRIKVRTTNVNTME